MADLKIKIKVNDTNSNLTKLSDAINGLYPTWEADYPDMDIGEYVQHLIMNEYLIPLIKDYEKTVIYESGLTQMNSITDISVDHDT